MGKTNSIFFALNSNMLLVRFYHARFLSDERLIFEENLHLHYITDSIDIPKSNSGCRSATVCPCNAPSKCPAIISQHAGTALVFVPLYLGVRVNVLVTSLSVLIDHCPQIF